jgi:hypothetical protein
MVRDHIFEVTSMILYSYPRGVYKAVRMALSLLRIVPTCRTKKYPTPSNSVAGLLCHYFALLCCRLLFQHRLCPLEGEGLSRLSSYRVCDYSTGGFFCLSTVLLLDPRRSHILSKDG